METYTPEQAAKIIQVNIQTIRKWLREGEMSGSNTPAGWRLTNQDIAEWLAKYRRNPLSTVRDEAP